MQKSNTKKQHKNEKHRLKFLKKTLILAYLFYIYQYSQFPIIHSSIIPGQLEKSDKTPVCKKKEKI